MRLPHLVIYILLSVSAVASLAQSKAIETDEKKKKDVGEKITPSTVGTAENEISTQSAGAGFLDYYLNERSASFSQKNKEISSSRQKQLDQIVDQLQAVAPDSYEYNLATYVNGNYDTELYPNLQKAYELNPASKKVLPQYAAYGELVNDASIKKEFSQKMKTAELFTPAEMEYNYNVLMSVAENGVLITNGQVDTYPLWILQTVDHVRPDIWVVNLDLLENKPYREQLGEKLGLGSNFLVEEDRDKRAQMIMKNSAGQNVHIAYTLSPELFKKYTRNLWATGLVFKLDGEKDVQNLDLLATHWKNDFRKSHIHENVGLNRNYVIPLSLLSTYFEGTGQLVELGEVNKLLEGLKVTKTKTKSATLKKY